MAPIAFKVCCVRDPDEADLAVAHGAAAIGLVSRMPSGPGVIDDDAIAATAAAARERHPALAVFLLTAETTPDAIAEQAGRFRPTALQLVAPLPPEAIAAVRERCPGLAVIPVVHVEGEVSIARALAVAPHADAILLDSGSPGAPTPELGGTGRPHDWAVSARIVEEVGRPVWLAGGLTPENVADAIARVRPHGVDVCSGLRPGGGDAPLDPDRLRRFAAGVGGNAADR